MEDFAYSLFYIVIGTNFALLWKWRGQDFSESHFTPFLSTTIIIMMLIFDGVDYDSESALMAMFFVLAGWFLTTAAQFGIDYVKGKKL